MLPEKENTGFCVSLFHHFRCVLSSASAGQVFIFCQNFHMYEMRLSRSFQLFQFYYNIINSMDMMSPEIVLYCEMCLGI